eukprot:2347832-Amphidinium_carterae.1
MTLQAPATASLLEGAVRQGHYIAPGMLCIKQSGKAASSQALKPAWALSCCRVPDNAGYALAGAVLELS